MTDSSQVHIPAEILLIKNGELALKGLNRGTFEDALIRNLRRALIPAGRIRVRKAQSTVYVEPLEQSFDMDAACGIVSRVFGIAAYSRARTSKKNMEDICRAAADFLRKELNAASTFKVEARRSDKTFPLNSPGICADVGEYILEQFPHLRVDVHHPEVQVVVEVRDFAAYVHGAQLSGAGGMPVGTSGKAALLISGGIDSPVAGYMMAKRGLSLHGIHFVSPPYTSRLAEMKVSDLMGRLTRYAGYMDFSVVPFTRIQEEIRRGCPEELFTVIMRRFMMRVATDIACGDGCGALITGESVGQVASQTMAAIACTDAASGLPVFRPLIGMDKEEIITISRKIDTFDISVQPFEDCCTVFQPKHPRTRPRLEAVLRAEQSLDADSLIADAVSRTQKSQISFDTAAG